ncbi:MAG: HAD family hydrolase [Eubacteriales bacterium]
MKTVKLIALDLDGTLIRENQVISAEDIAAIECAQQAGVPVVIATGRTFPTLEKILPRLHINTPLFAATARTYVWKARRFTTKP